MISHEIQRGKRRRRRRRRRMRMRRRRRRTRTRRTRRSVVFAKNNDDGCKNDESGHRKTPPKMLIFR